MKNKGFTLIELIALLGVIAIILLLSAPSLINQIESTRKNNYDNFVSDLCLAAEAYLNHSDVEGSDDLKNSGDSMSLSVVELISNGYVKSNIKNPKTNEKLATSDTLTITLTDDMTYKCTLNS